MALSSIDALIDKAVKGEIAGALMEKALDAIKMKLSLASQTSGLGLLEAPLKDRIEMYEAVAQAKAQSYLEGFISGLNQNISSKKAKKE
jgi:hypothetical protein